MAEIKTYYDIARENVEKAEAKLAQFDAREDEFSPENFQRRRQQYVDKLNQAKAKMQNCLSHMIDVMQRYKEEHPEEFEENLADDFEQQD